MEIQDAVRFYWLAVCRATVDFLTSFGLWTIFASAIGIGVAIAAHVYLVKRYPNLRERLGDPMNRWWIWVVYTLIPMGAIYNLAMAPARLYAELENKPAPAPIGDPKDDETINKLTRKLFVAEGERDKLQERCDDLQEELSTTTSNLSVANTKLDDRKRRIEMCDKLSEFAVSALKHRDALSMETPIPMDDLVAFKNELLAFAKII